MKNNKKIFEHIHTLAKILTSLIIFLFIGLATGIPMMVADNFVPVNKDMTIQQHMNISSRVGVFTAFTIAFLVTANIIFARTKNNKTLFLVSPVLLLLIIVALLIFYSPVPQAPPLTR